MKVSDYPVRMIVAGGRDFDNVDLLTQTLDHKISRIGWNSVEIVSGMAKGADSEAVSYATSRGLPIKKFPADWNKFGKKAGPIRNTRMADYATHLVAFWDGKSRGTGHMIRIAKSKGLNVQVVKY